MGVITVAVVASRWLTACGSAVEGDQTFTTVSDSTGHSHTLVIPETYLNDPPSSGLTAVTSTSSAHSHTITLSQSDLQNIADGQTVQYAINDGHQHRFDFRI